MWNASAGGREGCREHYREKKKVLQASMNLEPVEPAKDLPKPGRGRGLWSLGLGVCSFPMPQASKQLSAENSEEDMGSP